jgi:hypothetical protein
MLAAELLSIGSDISVFNEWTDKTDVIRQMIEVHINTIDESNNVNGKESIGRCRTETARIYR